MKLDQHEIQSSTWQKVVAHAEARLVKHRRRLENTSTSDRERDNLCQRIAEIKELLDLAEPGRGKVTDAD
jgi:hypothetical protein